MEMESETPCQRCGDMDYEGQVCQTCGAVADELYFGNEFNVFGTDKMPKFIPFKTKKNSPSLDFGLNVLDNLCKNYNVPFDMKAETESLLRQIYSSRYFARKQDIGILAGCCLVHIKQKHNQYASLSDLSAKLSCHMKHVYKFSKLIKSFCNDLKSSSESSSNSKELLNASEPAYQVSASEMLESTVPKMFASVEGNKDGFLQKTIALTKLAIDCWLMSGRTPEGVITAAGYLSWKSLNLESRLTFRQFCKAYSLPYLKASPKMTEMKEMLLKLGKKIPAASKNYVHEKNLLCHLNYILENSETLRNDLLTDTYKAEDIAKKEFSMYRKASTVTKEPDVANVERLVDFQPNTDVPDAEISDSEIDKYIRSEKEVKRIKKLKDKYDS